MDQYSDDLGAAPGRAFDFVYRIYSENAVEWNNSDIGTTRKIIRRRDGRRAVTVYAADKILFKDGEERRTFEKYEYKDGILLFRETTETYKFLLLTKDRIFYDNGREVLYLVWYE